MAKQWWPVVLNPTQVLLAPSWWEGKIFDQRQPDFEPTCTSQHLLSTQQLECMGHLRQDLSLPPTSSQWWKSRLKAWPEGNHLHQPCPPWRSEQSTTDGNVRWTCSWKDCRCETTRRARYREGPERTKTQEMVHKSLWQCVHYVSVCVCVKENRCESRTWSDCISQHEQARTGAQKSHEAPGAHQVM